MRTSGFGRTLRAALLAGSVMLLTPAAFAQPAGGEAVAGAEATAITVYQLPEASRPHDVAPAPDGNVYWTQQFDP